MAARPTGSRQRHAAISRPTRMIFRWVRPPCWPGCPRRPPDTTPVNLASAKQRQAQVLAAMVGEKFITAAEAQAAYAVKLQVFSPVTKFEAPYFVDYVLKTLAREHNIRSDDQRGYRVYTSLDLNLQHKAEQIVHEQIAQKGNFYNFHDAALVSMDPKTGEVLAMVGGDNTTGPAGSSTSPTTWPAHPVRASRSSPTPPPSRAARST